MLLKELIAVLCCTDKGLVIHMCNKDKIQFTQKNYHSIKEILKDHEYISNWGFYTVGCVKDNHIYVWQCDANIREHFLDSIPNLCKENEEVKEVGLKLSVCNASYIHTDSYGFINTDPRIHNVAIENLYDELEDYGYFN